MNETDLCFTPATELVDAVRAKKLSAVEIATAILNRAAALEPRLNAFAYLAAEEVMDAAIEADRALAKSEPMGPLHGVPVTIKEGGCLGQPSIEFTCDEQIDQYPCVMSTSCRSFPPALRLWMFATTSVTSWATVGRRATCGITVTLG